MSDEQKIDPALLEDGNPTGLQPGAAVNGGMNLKEQARGIRKINKKGLMVAGGVLATAAIVATTTFNGTGQAVSTAAQQAVATQEKTRPAEVKRDALWYANVPDKVASADPSFVPPLATTPGAAGTPGTAAVDLSKVPFPKAGLPGSTGAAGGTVVPDLTGKAVTPLGGAVAARTGAAAYDPSNPGAAGGAQPTPAQQAALQAAQQEAQEKQTAKQQQMKELEQASKAGLAASGFGGSNSPAPAASPAGAAAGGAVPGAMALPGMPKQGDEDPNKQEQKAAFLKAQRELVDPAYSSSYKTAPRSPYELKAGGLIPAVLISGINSDLPGQAIAQVRENVYDTKTGRHLLIAQGTRIVGLYDSHVASGQRRVLMAWNRLVFSNGSNFDLKGMPGSDMGGFAGFFDEVDNHYVRIFGSSALLSLISAGVQLSQPNYGGSTNTQPGVGQTVGGALGQQLGQTGMSITQKNLNIQPTLEIRPGYKFNIMVTADLILEPTK